MSAFKMPSTIIVWSIPRTGCHLLERILSNQQDVKYLLHPFAATRPSQREILNDMTIDQPIDLSSDQVTEYKRELEAGVQRWSDALETCTDRILFVHEHPFMTIHPSHLHPSSSIPNSPINQTAIPSTLLASSTSTPIPIFTIRHPILQARSVIKAIYTHSPTSSDHEILTTSSWSWSRALYDWYTSHNITPLVLDADDFMTSEIYMQSLCRKIGLRPEQALFTWPETPPHVQEQMHPLLRSIQGTLIGSTGLIAGRAARNVDLEEERKRWAREFQGKELKLLERIYADAVPHWEYLYQRRFVPDAM